MLSFFFILSEQLIKVLIRNCVIKSYLHHVYFSYETVIPFWILFMFPISRISLKKGSDAQCRLEFTNTFAADLANRLNAYRFLNSVYFSFSASHVIFASLLTRWSIKNAFISNCLIKFWLDFGMKNSFQKTIFKYLFLFCCMQSVYDKCVYKLRY